MKAVRLERPGAFQSIELAEPAAPGPGEALVSVRRIGVCGTDVSGYLGRMPLFSYPRILGHELGVRVEAVGDGVHHLEPGDACAVEPYLNCGACPACRRGQGNCCERLRVLGVHADGGMRPRLTLPAAKLHAARSLAFEQLALVETLAIGCHAVDRGDPQPDEPVLVVGAGPIGLSVIEFARLAGARVTVLERDERRLGFCRARGFTVLAATGDDAEAAALAAVADGGRFMAVFDATGSAGSMGRSLQYVAHGGTLVYVGLTAEPVTISDPLLHTREATIRGSRNALPGDFSRIIRLIEEERIDTGPWITHRTSFDGVIAAFPTLADRSTGVVKAMVELD